MDVEAWLARLGMEQYAAAFAEHDIDADTLAKLTSTDLQEIGVASVGHRRLLLEAIAQLVTDATAPTQPDPTVEKAPAAERRQLTVMFCDLVGSTALAERLDPEEMRGIIRSYQDAVAGEIVRFEGHVAKFMGDGVLAYFGWPNAHEDDAERAVRSGLAIAKAMGRLATQPGEPMKVRVGIATGLVVVGDLVGEGGAQEEAVVGLTPNLAARLQGLAAENSVVITESTRALLGKRFSYENLGTHQLRGVSEPVQVWRVIRPVEATSRFEAIRGPYLTPLAGRKEELGLLKRRWREATHKDGRAVLLTGEPGIGKSRIAHALGEEIAADPHLQLLYQCSPYHTNSALHPFIQQIEGAAGFEHGDTDDTKLDKLEALLVQPSDQEPSAVSLVASLLSIPSGKRYPPLAMSPQTRKEATLQVLVEQLAGVSERQPVLLVFEDVHWLDPTSQELLDSIVDRVDALPVLALITFRPDYAPPWTGQPHVTLLTLNRLNRDLGAAMVRDLSGRKALPDEVLEQIVTRTDGIPLFVEELTKTVLSSGLLEERQDRYAVVGDLPEHAIPSSLKDSLMARLDQLAPGKDVAQIGAVIGREFSYRLLAEASALSDDELDGALERLRLSELIFQKGVPPNARYLFKHALVQEAAYESLLLSRRQQIHARIAQVLEDRFPEQAELEPELLAHHFTEAGLTEQATTHWHRAGKHAVAQSAHVEAIEHLETALGLLKRMPNTVEHCRRELAVQTTLGPALMATKGWAAPVVGETFTRALELCRKLGDDAELFSVLRGLWEFHEAKGDFRTARGLAQQLLKLAERSNSPALLIVANDVMADTLFWLGDFSSSESYAEQGLALYNTQQHHSLTYRYGGYDPGVACLGFAAWDLWFLGYPERALQKSREALDLAQELSHPVSLVVALTWFAMLHHYRGDAAAAQRQTDEAMAIARKQSFSSWFAAAAMVNGWALAEQGRREEGMDRLRDSITLATADGLLLWRPYQLSLLAEVHSMAGQNHEARQLLAKAFAVAEETGERYWEAELHRLKGELLLLGAEDELAEAKACFNRSLEVARRQKAKSLELRAATSLGRLLQRQEKTAEARDALAPVHDWFTEGFDTADLTEAKAFLEKLS